MTADRLLVRDLVFAAAAGIAIAAACGLRAFLPLLAVGVAGRLDVIHLGPDVRWLEATPTLVCFGVATLLETAGDKVPMIDHALDVIGTAVRPLAGWLAAFALLDHWPAPWAQITALVLGGGALAVHSLKAKSRLGSTLLTLGHASPVLSLIEDAATLALVAVAILAPLLALSLAIVLIVAFARRRRAAGTTG